MCNTGVLGKQRPQAGANKQLGDIGSAALAIGRPADEEGWCTRAAYTARAPAFMILHAHKRKQNACQASTSNLRAHRIRGRPARATHA